MSVRVKSGPAQGIILCLLSPRKRTSRQMLLIASPRSQQCAASSKVSTPAMFASFVADDSSVRMQWETRHLAAKGELLMEREEKEGVPNWEVFGEGLGTP
jgi:hypothetical protein